MSLDGGRPDRKAFDEACRSGLHRGDLAVVEFSRGYIGAYRWPWEGQVLVKRNGLICAAHGNLFAVPKEQTVDTVLDAFEENGNEGLKNLDGELAFVVWDSTSGQLLLTRGAFGVKPLFIAKTSNRVTFGSEASQILSGGPAAATADRTRVREWLGIGQSPRCQTFFSGVERLLPGRLRILGPDDEDTTRRMYVPGPMTDWSISWTQAVTELPDLIGESVARRHWYRPVLTMSSGLDSTSIAGVIASSPELRETFSVDGAITAATISFPGHPCDETRAAAALARKLDFNHLTIDGTVSGPLRGEPEVAAVWQEPTPGPTGYQAVVDLPEYQSRGFRTYSLGIGGDGLWWGQECAALDALRCGRLTKAAGGPRGGPLDWWQGIRSAMLGDGGLLRGYYGAISHLTRGDDGVTGDDLPPFDTLSARRVFGRMERMLSGPVLEFIDQVSSHWQMTPSYPLLDRALVERAFQLPPTFMRRGRTFKALVRDAMRGILTDEIVECEKKVNYAGIVDEELRQHLASVIGESRDWRIWAWLERGGICSRSEVQHLCKTREWSVYQQWPVVALELWLRRVIP